MQQTPVGRAPDAGDIVVGWLVKLVVALSVVGVLLFDGVSLGAAELAVTDTAAAAAREARMALSAGATPQAAFDRAQALAEAEDAHNVVPTGSFVVGADESVSLLVRRTPPTLVLHHVPGSERWLVAEATTVAAVG